MKTTCNHFLHGPCMLKCINTVKYQEKLELDIVCPCAGCVVYETSKQKHWVIVSGAVTGEGYKTNEEIGRLKEMRDTVTVERLPHGWVKTSETTFQHKRSMIPKDARILYSNFNHDIAVSGNRNDVSAPQ